MLKITRYLLSLSLIGIGLMPGSDSHAENITKIKGLKSSASVIRDTDGIAHIKAHNEHDMFFLQGWIHAQDRLFQMDLNRRQPSGTLAEVLGVAALPGDVELRTIGLRRAATRSLEAIESSAASGDKISKGTLHALEAYAKGVNAFIAQIETLPPEYQALGLTEVAEWTTLDSLTIGKLIAFGLSFDLDDIDNTVNLQAYSQVLGIEAGRALYFDDLFRSAPFNRASTIPDSGGSQKNEKRVESNIVKVEAPVQRESKSVPLKLNVLEQSKQIAKQAKNYLAKVEKVPMLAKFIEQDRTALGSNEWAVTGKASITGHPIIANDPHLSLAHPSTFYPMQIRAKKYNAIGSGFAGSPFVVVGKNNHIAWGPTTNPMDVTDIFFDTLVQDPNSPSGLSIKLPGGELGIIVPVSEQYNVNADIDGDGQPDGLIVPVPASPEIPAVTLTVPSRNEGVIVDFDQQALTALTVQYTGFVATRELETFYAWNKAKNLTQFKSALTRFDFGSQNWTYTDRKGNLAYFSSAEMPVRTDLELLGKAAGGVPPYFIRQGDLDLHQWLAPKNHYPNQALAYEIYSPDEMPQLLNPANGYFVNANNDPVGTTFDNNPLNQFRDSGGVFYLNPGYAQGFRAGRITQGIKKILSTGDRKASAKEMQDLQADVGLHDAEFFAPLIVAAYRASQSTSADNELKTVAADERFEVVISSLVAWGQSDYQAKTGILQGYDSEDVDGDPTGSVDETEILNSRATSVYSMWRSEFIKGTIDTSLDAIGLNDFKPGSSQVITALRNLLEKGGESASGIDFFKAKGKDQATDIQIHLLKALSAALDRFETPEFATAFSDCTGSATDYRWGCLHRIIFASPLGGPFSVPNAFGVFPQPLSSLSGIPTDGGFGAVDASSHSARADTVDGFMYQSGATNRLIVESQRGDLKASSVWPSGTSAIPGNEFYLFPMLPNWLTNDAKPLRFQRREIYQGLHSSEFFFPD